ncbi:MAG: OmpA family protein [Desulfuromonadaceae bacterium]|nr:OmpA family protein [Desulfuromonadaceae bacterium]
MLAKTLSFIMLSQLIPLASHATDIRQRAYSYTYEAAMAKEEEQFVVCSNCPDNQLSMVPVAPKLALRLTASEKQALPPRHEEREALSKKSETGQTPVRTKTVLFDFDSAQLSRYESNRLIELLKGLPTTSTFDLKGYTCLIGTNAYNEKLSIRRAEHVAEILKANRLNVGTVEGRGTCCPVSNNKQLNRRVDIVEQDSVKSFMKDRDVKMKHTRK